MASLCRRCNLPALCAVLLLQHLLPPPPPPLLPPLLLLPLLLIGHVLKARAGSWHASLGLPSPEELLCHRARVLQPNVFPLFLAAWHAGSIPEYFERSH